jgi:transcriptional regulator of acetoin/glycerol metabolism
MMLAALERTRGNKAAAARELGISLSTLKRRLASFKPDAC